MIFYTIFIFPLETFFHYAYTLFYTLFNNYGVSIIGLSILVSTILLPLYAFADKLKNAEHREKDRMQAELDNISGYSGTEKHYYVQEIYRRHRYHPIKSLRVLVGLLIQIPFFIAAYHFLSHYKAFEGVSFLFIKNLAAPDGLLGGINLLPFVMTIVNLLSALTFTRGMSKGDKQQLYGLALLFLVLLYNSPAALVFYWTMNNVYSLGKSFFLSRKRLAARDEQVTHKPLQIKEFFRSANFIIGTKVLGVLFLYVLASYPFAIRANTDLGNVVIGLAIVLGAIIFVALLAAIIVLRTRIISTPLNALREFFKQIALPDKTASVLIILLWFSISILSFFLPSTRIIASSPGEFFAPISLSMTMLAIALAVLAVATLVTIVLRGALKKFFYLLTLFVSAYIVCNYFILAGNYGVMDFFIFGNADKLKVEIPHYFLDITLFFASLLLAIWLLRAVKAATMLWVSSALALAIVIASISPIYTIVTHRTDKPQQEIEVSDETLPTELPPMIHFSPTGQNVLVLFFDRFIGGYMPDILEDIPTLKNDLSGFTWYPNTLSFGPFTFWGLPPMYGGYEYADVNKARALWAQSSGKYSQWGDPELIRKYFSQTNPITFKKFLAAGWQTNFIDPSDMSDLVQGSNPPIKQWGELSSGGQLAERYNGPFFGRKANQATLKTVKDNVPDFIKGYLLPFSFFKIGPVFARPYFYHGGVWRNHYAGNSGYVQSYLNHYSSAKAMQYVSRADAKHNSYTFVTNMMTHDVYAARDNGEFYSGQGTSDFANLTDNANMDAKSRARFKDGYAAVHFFADKAALVEANELFIWMKKNKVYDNTKIFVISDHGRNVYDPMFGDSQTTKKGYYRASYHPLLLVKDFNTSGPLKIDNSFMTNADLFPMSLQVIDPDALQKYGYDKSKGFRIYSDAGSLVVHDNIFDPNNWIESDDLVINTQ